MIIAPLVRLKLVDATIALVAELAVKGLSSLSCRLRLPLKNERSCQWMTDEIGNS